MVNPGQQQLSARSRTVGILKILLPAGAVALLAAVFFWTPTEDSEGGLTFSEDDIEAMRTGLKITGPQFSGASLGGDVYDFSADTVVPRDLDLTAADIETLTGRVIYRDGRIVNMQSDRATIDISNRRVTLETGIRITTSDGYQAQASRLDVDVREGVLQAEGPVEASGPMGEIRADALRISPQPVPGGEDDEFDTIIHFTGSVTMTYTPAELRGDE